MRNTVAHTERDDAYIGVLGARQKKNILTIIDRI